MKIKNLHINPKKIMLLATTLILVTTMSKAKGEIGKLTEVDYTLMNNPTIAQNSDIIKSSGMKYNGKNFWENGCGPSSIINSLILGFDYSDQENIVGFSQEVLRIFAIKHKPLDNSIKVTEGVALDLDQSNYIIKHKDEFPILYGLLTQYEGEIEYIGKKIKPETVLNKLDNGNTLIIGKASLQDELTNYISLAYDLYQKGYYDAEIIINCVQVGKEEWNRPFKTKYGHYCTYYINVKQFIEEGAIYLIDSLPRALEGEFYGNESIYKDQYAFVNNKSYKTFNTNFTCERITPTIVKLNFNSYEKNMEKSIFIKFVNDTTKCLSLGGNVGIVINIPTNEKTLFK